MESINVLLRSSRDSIAAAHPIHSAGKPAFPDLLETQLNQLATNDTRYALLDPVAKAKLQADIASVWEGQVRSGQKSLCGQASF